ncbi:MAG: ribbon-helix-helix domain-containing protein [Rhizobiaceae bacterium]|nr:ribbon-helix-helix domain-containing protein [Rhizobiaceae bacterium]
MSRDDNGGLKPASLEKDPFTPEFRVVARGNVRRGIRLERIFWVTLKRIAESRKITMGALIEEIAESHGESGNLTSAIRVTCLKWLDEQNSLLRDQKPGKEQKSG